MRKNIQVLAWLLMLVACFVGSELSAQVRLRVVVNSGSSATTCTDFIGQPDRQWRVNIGNQGWTTYPRSGICFTNTPNTQFDEEYLCPTDMPAQLQVCFRAFEDDGASCIVSEDCAETLCQNFVTPAPGTSATYTITIPPGGGNRSSGTVNFTISATGAFNLPGFANDLICNAIDLGLLNAGSSVGNNGLSNYGNFCAGNAGDPAPTWNNEQGVWFRFTTSSNPGAVIRIDATNDPQGRGDQIDLQLALYRSSNGTCTGGLTRIASEHDIPLYAEEMAVECLQPNTTYFLLVDGADNGIFGGQEGFFGLQIFDGGIRQAGDLICDAENLGQVPTGGSVGTPNLSRSNVCATNTGDPTPGAWSAEQSVWFSFQAPASGHAIIEAESDLPAPFGTDAVDLQLALYSTNNNNCSGTLTYIDGTYSILGFDEELEARCLEPNRIYWIMVDGSGLNVDGIFDIRVRDGGIPPAPNDRICNAIPLGQPAPNGTVGLSNQNNFCADNIFEPIPTNWGNDQGVWYTFIAPPSGKVEVRSVSQGIFGDPIDLQLVVYDSDDMTCTGSLTELASEHEGIGLLWDEDMEVECLIPGRTYFLMVDGEGSLIDPGLQEGIFSISVYGDPRDPPAPNDNICNAVYMGDPTGTSLQTGPGVGHGSQNNFCATSAGEPDPSGFNPRQTVWYSFTAPSTGNVRIQGTSDAIFGGVDAIDLNIAVWEASNNACSGGTFREIQSGDDLLYDFDMEVYCLEPGRLYFVQIDGAGPALLGGQEGYFDLRFTEMAPIPVAVNDLICNAIPMGNPITQGTRTLTNQHNLCADNIGDPTPSAFNPRQTVWYSFDVPATGGPYAVEIDATSSLPWPFGSRDAIDLQLAVYSSSNNACTGTLTEVESEYDLGFFDETVLVQCLEPGRTYYVMVNGSFIDEQGYFDLSIAAAPSVPIPTNDNICQHIDLGTVPVGGVINNGTNYFNFCASTESGEPSPFTIDQTVWFSFVAPNHAGANATSNVTVRVTSDPGNVGNDVDLQLAVYESSNNACNGSLNRLGDADPLFSRNAEVELTCLYPGRRYWVQVDGSFFDVDGYFRVQIEDDGAGIRPTNNAICNAIPLGQVPAGGTINNNVNYLNLCSDTEAGEPNPSAFSIEQTVWFSFQAPASGNATVTVRNDPNNVGDQIDLQMAIYQVQNCTGPFIEIASSYNPFGFDEAISLECLVPGGLYYVQVDGADGGLLGGEEGYFTIRVRDDGGTSNFPYNNDICNAFNFGTPTGVQQIRGSETNICANLQFSEPGVGSYANHTVWYQFTAPPSARVRIRVRSNDVIFGLDPEVYVFSSSNNTCTGVFSRIESSTLPTALITETIEATCLIAGNTYFIQVDGQGIVEEGDFTIRIEDMEPLYGLGVAGDPEPINNNCANAVPLTVQSESCFNGTGTFQTFNYGQPTISYNPNFVRACNENCGDTWYSFVMPASGVAILEANDDNIGPGFPVGDFSEATVAAYTGTCGNLTPLDCASGGFTDDVTYEISAPPGTTVFLQVFNDAGDDDGEDYQLCVSQGCGADHCLNAVNFPIQPNVLYCFNTAGATAENVSGGAPGYFECGENDNPEHSIYYYFVSDCNGSDVTINVINAFSAGGCILGITPSDGFNISFFQDATPCDNSPDALVDCQNFNSCMVQPINWSQTYTNLLPNTPYVIQIDGGFNFLGGDNSGYIMIETTTNPVAVPVVTPLSCGSGLNDGTATFIVAGGVPPFTFLWSNGSTDSINTNLATGTYFATITGANGCVDTASAFVPAPPNSVVANINNITNETCANQCDGTATVAGSNGLPPYTYTWDSFAANQTTATATGLCAGNYSVTISDNAGCFQTTVVGITNPNPISVTITSTTDATCSGCDGIATAQGAGGTIAFAYTFNWSVGNSFPTATGLCQGVHTVTATDDNGCSAVAAVTITQPLAITATLANQTNVLCNGLSTGTAEVLVGNGQAPYSFAIDNINPAQTTGIFSNLSAGSYNVTIADAAGCRAFVPFTITEPSALVATLVASIDPSCNGANDGEITVAATVGTGTAPYTYAIDGINFQSANTFAGLTAGNYTITTRDANNCSTNTAITLTQPNAITITNGTQTVASCGTCDAAANVTIAGGSSSYTFLWSNGETSQNATALCAGNAQITVTDNLGCQATSQFNISNSSGFSVSANINQAITCAGACDAAIAVTPNAGTAPYQYLWTNGSTSSTLTGLCAGSYQVTITDANACIVSQTIDVLAPDALQAQAAVISAPACLGGTDGEAIATATGGTAAYTYLWSNTTTSQTATGLAAGIVAVTITDANACTAIAQVTISEPSAISLSTQNVSASDCATTGCTGSATVLVSQGTAPYNYIWTNGSTVGNPINLCPNFNTVTVTDANGCTATTQVNIPANTSLNIDAITATPVACFGNSNGTASITVSGGNTATPYNFIWSNGSTTNAISNVAAANYQVTVTDTDGCSAATVVQVSSPTAITVTTQAITDYNGFEVSCFAANDGGISVTAQGGTAPYRYIWSNAVTTANNTALPTGIYDITVSDANTCTATSTISIAAPAVLALNAAVTSNYNGAQLSCVGATDATAEAIASGGVANYTYLWTNAQTNSNATALAAGTHNVTATDANGCTISQTVTITPPSVLSATVAATTNFNGFNTTCHNTNDAQALANATGGTAPYRFLWSNGTTTNNTSGLAAGVHTVTIQDANNCVATTSLTITSPAQLALTANILNQVSCFGGSNGQAQATATSGVAPYTFIWDNSETTAIASALNVGAHTVTVTDANGCTAQANLTMTQPAVLTVSATATNVLCFGQTSATASATVSGGTTPYNYNWSAGSPNNNSNIGNLPAGTHRLTVTDANNCIATATFTVSQPALLSATASVASSYNGAQISCPSSADGVAQVVVVGGSPTYTYRWINGETTAIVSGLQASNYPVTVTDANGCQTTATVSVTPPAILTIATNITSNFNGFNVACFGGNNGSAIASAAGGTGNYQFVWSGGQAGANANNMLAGVYNVTATDANGCAAVATGSLTSPTAITHIFSNVVPVACFGGSNGQATITAAGGFAPYTFLWANGQTQATNTGLSMGLPRVTITDANGCTQVASISISQPAIYTISTASVSNTLCATSTDGAIDINVQGATAPYTYLWSNGQTTQDLANLSPATYRVTITDANGCQTTTTASVSSPSALLTNISVLRQVQCAGAADAEIRANTGGGVPPYRFLWSNGATSQQLVGLSAGTYSFTATDANNCSSIATITLSQPAAMTVTAQVTSNYNGQQISCRSADDGTAIANVSGGTAPYQYFWFVGESNQTVTGLTRGIYNAQVTDANGCIAYSAITINDPSQMELSVTAQHISCFGANDGVLSAVPSGGTPNYTYNWSNGRTTSVINNLTPNVYGITVSDANGCTITWLGNILQPQPLFIADSETLPESCAGRADGAAAVGGISGGTVPHSLQWSNGQTGFFANGLAAGTHTLTVTDGNGCTLVHTVQVGSLPTISVTFANIGDIVCNNEPNGTATVVVEPNTGTAPYTFLWDNGFRDSVAVFLHEGYNRVTVTDANGCAIVDSVLIQNPNPLEVQSSSQNITCFGANNGQAQVTVSGGVQPYTYSWSHGFTGAVATNLLPDTLYWVTVTDANSCIELRAFYLYQPSPLEGAITRVEDESCDNTDDGFIFATATGAIPPYNFVWSNGITNAQVLTSTITGLNAGIYALTITDANGCLVRLDTTVNQPTALSATATGSRTSCYDAEDGTISVIAAGGTPPYLYAIDGGTPASSSVFTGLGAGTYSVQVFDANDCPFLIQNIRITRPDSILLVASPDVEIMMGDVAQMWVRMPVNAPQNPRVSWTPNINLSCDTCFQTTAQPFETTLYTVTIVGDDGCPSQSEVLITVDGKLEIFIPTAFSPNGDNTNDIFMVYGRPGLAHIDQMLIFDRWGELVFEVSDAPINYTGYGWDGTFKGKPLNVGVFAYVIKLTYIDGTTEIRKGDITIFR
jgi:large repetitive protein